MSLYADMNMFLDSICDDKSTTHIHISSDIVNLGLALNMYLKLQGHSHSRHMEAGNTFTTETWCQFMKELLKHVHLPKDLKQMVSRAKALNIRWEDFAKLDEYKTVEAKVQFLYSLGDNAVNMFIPHAPHGVLGHRFLGEEREVDLSSDDDDEQKYDQHEIYEQYQPHQDEIYEQYQPYQPDFQLDRIVQLDQSSGGRGILFKGIFAGVILMILLSLLMTMGSPTLPEQDYTRCPARTVTWETAEDNCKCAIPRLRLSQRDRKVRRDIMMQLHPDKNIHCPKHAHEKMAYCSGCKKPDE